MTTLVGTLRALKHEYEKESNKVSYTLSIGDQSVPLHDLLGKNLTLSFLSQINCVFCDRPTKKSFGKGSCYSCFTTRAENDLCLMKPHTCHFDLGTCRDQAYAERYCLQPHYVYLALSSGMKVGLTRKDNEIRRWTDQGAIKGLVIAELPTRKLAGQLEFHLSQYVPDKTNWRKMLKGDVEDIDLLALREQVYSNFPEAFRQYQLPESTFLEINYPEIEKLSKITSFNFDKDANVSGRLLGIKGQYLILDTGVLNVRKFEGYRVGFRVNA